MSAATAGLRVFGLGFTLLFWWAIPLRGQNLYPEDVRVGLDSALVIAKRTAATAFPDLSSYLLYSIAPRVFKGDKGGLHWQVSWQERAFPHRRWLVVRVYMNDGHARTERIDEPEPPGNTNDPE